MTKKQKKLGDEKREQQKNWKNQIYFLGTHPTVERLGNSFLKDEEEKIENEIIWATKGGQKTSEQGNYRMRE